MLKTLRYLDYLLERITLLVYAWDAAGNVGASEIVAFTVAEPEPELEPFPTVPAAAISVASIAAVAAGLLLYHRKRREEATQK